MAKPRILVLMCAGTVLNDLSVWAIQELAQVWMEEGLEVKIASGPQGAIPADLLFLHVDLSVVPDEYLALADRYPVAVNGRVKDIRKSSFSAQLVRPGDGWEGPCIVKSDLNCGGEPETKYAGRGVKLEFGPPLYPFRLRSQLDYRVYENPSTIPPEYFQDPYLVVEKFLPEIEGGWYFTRSCHFLGNAHTTVRLGSPSPVVVGKSQKVIQEIEPTQAILDFRQKAGLDYGKIDYLIHEGELVILDINKTTGRGGVSADPRVLAMRRERARGIWDFLR